MSAFLGPIHHWLYGKVLFQNEMIEKIASLAIEEGWITESLDLDRYGVLESGALEDIVDPDNIHGWLQERVSLVENKLAYLVTVLVKEAPERIIKISNAVYQLGVENKLQNVSDAKSAFTHLENLLLNGMPCDRINKIIEENEEHVIWEQTQDIHAKYWEAMQGDLDNFYIIRKSLITGILEDSGFQFIVHNNFTYEIKR